MSKVIGTMVFCLTCRTVVWAHDSDLGDVRGILNMMKIPCRLCQADGRKWKGYDGWNPTTEAIKSLGTYDGWSTMKEIARRNDLQWDISPDLSWNLATTKQTLTVMEAAQILGIGRQTAYELARRDELPGVRRLGGRFIVAKRALHAYLAGTSQKEVHTGYTDDF